MVYQYKICPFCNKLKAVMDYLGIPYNVTEVSKPLCCVHRLPKGQKVLLLYCGNASGFIDGCNPTNHTVGI